MGGANIPIALASSFLLHLLRIRVNMTILGKIARKMLDVVGSTVGEASVIAKVLLVGAGH